MSPVVVITGAASGVGAACVARFLDEGWSVGAFDVADPPGRDGVHAILADVTDPDAVARGMRAVAEALGPPRACLNVAGVYPRSELQGFDVQAYRHIFDVNVLGTLLVSQAFVAERDRGEQCSILNIASQDGYVPARRQLLYSASKAAVINATASMARELEPENVRVNALAPADIATERLRELRGRGDLGDRVAEPAHVAELCWAIAGERVLPLVSGETIKVEASALDRTWRRA
jgi:NAD(P)-dependent dehydrogenase (short-subunit alcohol dehydrogenase family)